MRAEYDYFDHEADMGIIGRGDTIEEAFIQAARAVFANMTDLSQIKPRQTITVQFTETDLELALVEWLNYLLAAARQAGCVFSDFALRRENDAWIGAACGEPWREGLERGTEVKGATLTQLSVKRIHGYWEARCVVDV
jgi:protein archease